MNLLKPTFSFIACLFAFVSTAQPPPPPAGDDTPPTFTSATAIDFEENGTGIAYLATADETVVFTINDSKDGSLFVLSNANEIRFIAAPDFENPQDEDSNNSYILDITATDGAENSTIQEVTITVLDVDDIAPVFTSPAAVNFEENTASIAYTATTDENATFNLGTTKDESLFSLANGNEISFLDIPDFENPLDGDNNNEYLIDLTATDNAGNSTTQQVVITVLDLDDTAPVFTSDDAVSFNENSVEIAYTALANEEVTFMLGSAKDENLFLLNNGNEIRFINAPDFENPLDGDSDNEYLIDVTATDNAGNSATLAITITVLDVDDSPSTFTSPASVIFEENDTDIAYLATADETVTFSLGSAKDESLFSLTNENEIRFINTPDFEDPQDGDSNNEYLIDISATDLAGNVATLAVTITVLDIDEIAPQFTSASAVSFQENETDVVLVVTTNETTTISLEDTKDGALFFISDADEVRFTSAPDFENPLDGDANNEYLINITAIDAAGNSASQEVTITVLDIDDTAPTFTSSSFVNFEENGTGMVYTATANESVVFTLGTSNDEALFTLLNDNEIQFNSAPDFEDPQDANSDNDYLLDLIATDEAGNSALLQLVVRILDVDEIAPTFTSGNIVTFEENVTETAAYTASADETVIFSLGTTKDEPLFFLNNALNMVFFISAPDFENPQDQDGDNNYLIDITATDLEGNSTTLEVTITVTDVDDAPVLSIPEANDISVHPNPTNGELFIVDGNTPVAIYEVLDLTGKRVMAISDSSNKQAIDLSHLPQGQYLLLLHLEDESTFLYRIIRD